MNYPAFTDALSGPQALALAEETETASLVAAAAARRDQYSPAVVTYSRKVFLPLTELCRDVCHYCTFAKTPRRVAAPYMSVEEALRIAREGAKQGCKEALFTLGEKPELRYSAAREALAKLGFESTVEYLAHVAERVLLETGLLPHINAGNMSLAELQCLRRVSPSMGLMLESASPRLCEKGMPHYGSPDKEPTLRLETLRLAGQAKIPFTTGILIGIGETRLERIESLLAIREVHAQYGHIQEVIVQNFRAKPGTPMAQAPEPDLDDLLWTIAVARLIMGSEVSIQAPPNLSPGALEKLIAAGINDWGGVSPVTPDHVNPEAPWPHLDNLANSTRAAGKSLEERLTIYPRYVRQAEHWVDKQLLSRLIKIVDADGYPRQDDWLAGHREFSPPIALLEQLDSTCSATPAKLSPNLISIVDKAMAGKALHSEEIVRLFRARGAEFGYVCRSADQLRKTVNGDGVSYVVNRNINYTNICSFKCTFCAFSKGKTHADLRGKPYDLSETDITNRVREARLRGATEVCMQGGIHPDYSGKKYLDIVRMVKRAEPQMHVHAFSPLEVWEGARTLNISVDDFLNQLQEAGLSTLPGTAAEILDDSVRQIICPDKINTAQWLTVIEAAHRVGLKTTATIMFGHVDNYQHWARHLLEIRKLQQSTAGITEFVPLPFVADEAPIFRRGRARRGPSFREAVLMHAVARLVFSGLIDNIQASWVKMGPAGVAACLQAGANDLGGTLMDESITRAAGAQHGQEFTETEMTALAQRCGRWAFQRTTDYRPVAGRPQRIAADHCLA